MHESVFWLLVMVSGMVISLAAVRWSWQNSRAVPALVGQEWETDA
jgi:hypothetical protein